MAPTLMVPATNTTGSYSISWTAVTAATTYRLEERINSGSWAEIQNSSVRSKAFSGKTTATYSYRVRACNAGGCGSYSAMKSVAVTTAPATPTITSATVTQESGRLRRYDVTWTSSVGATSYELWGPEYDDVYGDFDQVEIYIGPNTSYAHYIFSMEEPTGGFRVRACNSVGCSTFSPNVYPTP